MHPHTDRYGVKVSGARAEAPHGPRADEQPIIGYSKSGAPIYAIGGGAVDAPPRPGFLELVETLRSEEASLDRLYGNEGRAMGRRNSPEWKRKVAEFLKIVNAARSGDHRAHYILRETQTTDDFPELFGDVLQRQLLGMYQETTPTWANYARRSEVPDFRTVKRFAVDGAEGVLDVVDEQGQYPAAALSETKYEYSVQKRGRRVPFSWEAMINDDLGALQNSPERLARAARRSEERFATGLFVDVNGPHASFYTAGNSNIVNTTNGASADNPPLSISALQDAMTVLGNQVDADGEPIAIETVQLVVPPSLAVTAQNILNALQIELTTAGGTRDDNAGGQRLIAQNWMRNQVTINVNPYIPLVADTANGATSWFLFATPMTGRPALELGFLRGHAAPELFRRVANAMRVSGGSGPIMESFDDDTVDFKIRHVFGGTRLDPKATVASNGSGS